MNLMDVISAILAEAGQQQHQPPVRHRSGKRRHVGASIRALRHKTPTTGGKPSRHYGIRVGGFKVDRDASMKRKDGAVVLQPTSYHVIGKGYR